ncbi:MAG: peptidylprolyl isomerase [Candidatus Lernaella stagnicola]|nr:peptidylprolyl isomerase [Candidatus Lernaella stagnicola]
MVALILLCACRAKNDLPEGVLARVDQHEISVAEFESAFAQARDRGTVSMPEDEAAQLALRQAFLEFFIDRLLLEREGERRGIDVSRQDIEAEIRAMYAGWELDRFKRAAGDPAWLFQQIHTALLIERIVEQRSGATTPDEEAVAAYFAAHPEEFQLPEQARVRQIVCADRSQATMALTDLLTGGDFAKVAAATSIAPEAKRGGDLGFVTRGELLPDIEEAAFSLPVGEISSLLESPFGVHIIQVLERLPAKTLTLPEARPKIEHVLRRRRATQAWRALRRDLREQATITVDRRRLPGPTKE